MTSSAENCVLVAEIIGDGPLVQKLGQVEANRAIERCLARAERSISGNSGTIVSSQGRRLVATFADSEDAVLAAQDIRQRVAQLPPVSGVLLSVRSGIHADAEGAGALIDGAVSGDILLSSASAEGLPDTLRTVLNEYGGPRPIAAPEGVVFQFRAGAQTLRETTRQPASPPPQRSAVNTAPKVAPGRGRMMLRHQGSSFIISESHPVLLAGREEGNDVVVVDRRASRQHARIEWRAGRYMLVDSSTNGTYLVDGSGTETILRRTECELPATGRIGFGYSPQELGVEMAMFDIGQR
ncbi:FHA domain-containing protein [Uliginosibacterium sp. sgz301328]|uniref:FHA domain-containing protein n=1 Tax=Uliginosibacterium sp. sgz301328 TaxID=3243764 RepID=UPI00359CDD82